MTYMLIFDIKLVFGIKHVTFYSDISDIVVRNKWACKFSFLLLLLWPEISSREARDRNICSLDTFLEWKSSIYTANIFTLLI